jgi:hypothetical protein
MNIRTERAEGVPSGRVIIDFDDEAERLKILQRFAASHFCANPDQCAGKGYCPRNPVCGN